MKKRLFLLTAAALLLLSSCGEGGQTDSSARPRPQASQKRRLYSRQQKKLSLPGERQRSG